MTSVAERGASLEGYQITHKPPARLAWIDRKWPILYFGGIPRPKQRKP